MYKILCLFWLIGCQKLLLLILDSIHIRGLFLAARNGVELIRIDRCCIHCHRPHKLIQFLLEQLGRRGQSRPFDGVLGHSIADRAFSSHTRPLLLENHGIFIIIYRINRICSIRKIPYKITPDSCCVVDAKCVLLRHFFRLSSFRHFHFVIIIIICEPFAQIVVAAYI